MKKKNIFVDLKIKLREMGLKKYADVAEVLGMPLPTFKAKMAGKLPWKDAEMYDILEIIREPFSMIAFYFPPDDVRGITKEVA